MPNLQPEKYFRESARKTFTRRKSAAEEESRLSRRSSGPRSPVTAGAVAGGEVDAVALQCDIDCVFETAAIKRRAVGPKDVQIDVKYCGVCHSDLTFAVGATKDLGIPQHWPVVPGHEVAGVVVAVGSDVTKFQTGDHVGVGCMVGSDLTCRACKRGDENMCLNQVPTYGGALRKDDPICPVVEGSGETQTMGGYSTAMVVNEHFCISIPKAYPLECAGPVMCAGVTVYNPLSTYGVKEGSHVGIIGLGGLGTMGIKVAKALGARVTAISRGEKKRALALSHGADDFIDSKSPASLESGVASLDCIINVIPVYHDVTLYTPLLKPSTGKMYLIGITESTMAAFAADALLLGSSVITASLIGGIACTQEVMDLCAKYMIKPVVEVAPTTAINRIFESLNGANEAGVRYVIDIAGARNPPLKLGLSFGEPTDLHTDSHGGGHTAPLSASKVIFYELPKMLLVVNRRKVLPILGIVTLATAMIGVQLLKKK